MNQKKRKAIEEIIGKTIENNDIDEPPPIILNVGQFVIVQFPIKKSDTAFYWQILNLNRPFKTFNHKMFYKTVILCTFP